MTIDSLKDLEKLMKLCKKQQVGKITVDGITFELDLSTPQRTAKAVDIPDLPSFAPGISAETQIDTPDELTKEQLMFYSAGGQ